MVTRDRVTARRRDGRDKQAGGLGGAWRKKQDEVREMGSVRVGVPVSRERERALSSRCLAQLRSSPPPGLVPRSNSSCLGPGGWVGRGLGGGKGE